MLVRSLRHTAVVLYSPNENERFEVESNSSILIEFFFVFQHPRSIEDIVKCTRFSKAEIRLLYRSFKQVIMIQVKRRTLFLLIKECPSGNINEERLRGIYLQFFPQGSS